MPAARGRAAAQGVTTGSISGTVKDPQGQVVPGATVTATHEPSGTVYEGFTRGDGRFSIPGMRVGGPYKVEASLTGFTSESMSGINVSLGVATDLDFTLKVANVAETITVVGVSDPVFSSTRTGPATAVARDELAALPTITGRLDGRHPHEPAAWRQRLDLRRTGQPREQRHRGRLVFQQLVRPRRDDR